LIERNKFDLEAFLELEADFPDIQIVTHRNKGIDPFSAGHKSTEGSHGSEKLHDKKQTGWRIWSGEWKVWMIEAIIYLAVLLAIALAKHFWLSTHAKTDKTD
jgi:hypothetical protein